MPCNIIKVFIFFCVPYVVLPVATHGHIPSFIKKYENPLKLGDTPCVAAGIL
jgi:hypothetical protein